MDDTQVTKLNAIVERNALFDKYIDAVTKLQVWEAGRQLTTDNVRYRPERREKLLNMMRENIADISAKMRALDAIITGVKTSNGHGS